MNHNKSHNLTPEQAADVVNYYYFGANAESRAGGWRDKVPIGQAAVQATLKRHSILPEGNPMLTPEEMSAGLKYISDLRSADVVDIMTSLRPSQLTEARLTLEQEAVVDRLVDAGVGNYDDARRRVAGL